MGSEVVERWRASPLGGFHCEVFTVRICATSAHGANET
jgi:hypothetical protein